MLLLIERTRTHGEVTPAGMEDTYVPKQMKLCTYVYDRNETKSYTMKNAKKFL